MVWGGTQVLCSALIEDGVPEFLVGSEKGWLTAEYSMLPGSTPNRRTRDVTRGKLDGRSAEIQRLVGRSLRASVDLRAIPGRTLYVDCDVLQADGGTRTAAINGAWLAVRDAFARFAAREHSRGKLLTAQLAAVSVGVVAGETLVDLAAVEDQRAEVDMNVIKTDAGAFVEVQGTAEKGTFERATLDRLLALADSGIEQVLAAQRAVPALDPGR